ncbi:hypothetical protein [Streptomyces sp. NPDC057686]|uniref:hypothetical protein n=1 Tax=Streptomyces sp. NPDC057686 TaxID=3346212 RepID=UPI00368B2046
MERWRRAWREGGMEALRSAGRLPSYAPDLNPVEAIWSLDRAMANTAFETPEDLDRKLRRELHKNHLRPHLIDGCLTAPGLTLTPPTPP